MSLYSQTMFHEELEFHEDNIESDLMDHGSVPGTPPISSLDSYTEEAYGEEEEIYDQTFSSPFYTLPNEDPEATPIHDFKRRRTNSMELQNPAPSFSDNPRDLIDKSALEPCPSTIEKIEQKDESPAVDQVTLTTIDIQQAQPIKRKRGRPPGKKKSISKEFEVYPNPTGLMNGIQSSNPDLYYIPSQSMNMYTNTSGEDQSLFHGSPIGLPGSVPQTPIKRGRGRPRKLPLPVQAPGEDWNSFNMRVAATHGPNFKPIDVHLNLPSDFAITNYIKDLLSFSNSDHQDTLSLESMKQKLDDHFHVDFSCRYNFLKEVYYIMYL